MFVKGVEGLFTRFLYTWSLVCKNMNLYNRCSYPEDTISHEIDPIHPYNPPFPTGETS